MRIYVVTSDYPSLSLRQAGTDAYLPLLPFPGHKGIYYLDCSLGPFTLHSAPHSPPVLSPSI